MRTIAIVALLMVSPLQSFAQGTGGVFGPVVNEGHRAGEYRSTWDESDVWQQRFHYQSAIDDLPEFIESWERLAWVKYARLDETDEARQLMQRLAEIGN